MENADCKMSYAAMPFRRSEEEECVVPMYSKETRL